MIDFPTNVNQLNKYVFQDRQTGDILRPYNLIVKDQEELIISVGVDTQTGRKIQKAILFTDFISLDQNGIHRFIPIIESEEMRLLSEQFTKLDGNIIFSSSFIDKQIDVL